MFATVAPSASAPALRVPEGACPCDAITGTIAFQLAHAISTGFASPAGYYSLASISISIPPPTLWDVALLLTLWDVYHYVQLRGVSPTSQRAARLLLPVRAPALSLTLLLPYLILRTLLRLLTTLTHTLNPTLPATTPTTPSPLFAYLTPLALSRATTLSLAALTILLALVSTAGILARLPVDGVRVDTARFPAVPELVAWGVREHVSMSTVLRMRAAGIEPGVWARE